MKSISISNIMDRLVARNKDAAENENGFSLLELVVAIGILLILTVGGLLGYAAITDNARDAAVNSAASEVATAVMVAQSDDKTDNDDVTDYVATFNGKDGYKDITFSVDTGETEITATHAKGNSATRTIDVGNWL